MPDTEFDFGGWATKNNLRCSDGRIIMPNAFAHNSGHKVPLVWQHAHSDPANILGYAILENRPEGVYARGKFNMSAEARRVRESVIHGDIDSMSIYANELQETAKNVTHGTIREVSLVISGANPGAKIDPLTILHADGSSDTLADEAIIFTGITGLSDMAQAADDKTVADVIATFTDEQKTVFYAVVAAAMGESDSVAQSDGDENFMSHNVFDGSAQQNNTPSLTHEQLGEIFGDAQRNGSLKQSFLAHVQTYGIENIDYLFPDAQAITNAPSMITRDMRWVNILLDGTRHSPMSRIKTLAADITAEEARARGYVKAALKKEEILRLLKRVTTPTTIYKKQKLDRDDVIDIVDLDVVAWQKSEMRVMLDEELARAVLISDGRAPEHEAKIDELCIRPIYKDDDMYVHRVRVLSNATTESIIDDIIRSRKEYKGSGSPTMFVPEGFLTDMLLVKDTTGRRIYDTQASLEATLRVSKIVEVPVMDNVSRITDDVIPVTLDLLAILVNLGDYTIGADKGGAISMFDDFDIDYNQLKFLLETRCSGALTLPKSAVVMEKVHAAG